MTFKVATPYHHSLSSVRKWGGAVDDFLPLHDWFDQSKESVADFRHRFLRHHAPGIFELERVFGPTITISTGRVIPTRLIGEQHVSEDFGGFIPSLADWARAIRPAGWMLKAVRLNDQGGADSPRQLGSVERKISSWPVGPGMMSDYK
jgi:hypothetical protein